MKATLYSTDTEQNRTEALAAAQKAIKEKKTIVLPTDTVYGIGADAFSPEAVTKLLSAKGRSRRMPPPVLIYSSSVLPGLADELSADASALAEAFWPGALTIICYSQPSLNWDLGDTQGTVALRVPDDEVAIDVLRLTGPLAVSSANKTGRPAAVDAQEALDQLGDDVELILDAGSRALDGEGAEHTVPVASTIVDCTGEQAVVVREGAISLDALREVVPEIVTKAELESRSQLKDPQENHDEFSELDDDFLEPDESSDTPSYRQAPVPASGSLHERLVSESSPVSGIDQRRSLAQPVRSVRQPLDTTVTKPLSTAQAHSLVFDGIEDEDSTE
ncbi:L-threonylcarbamoyladenylate synthase [Rothia sp. CCM 9418]|uniref:L-threonylcarbamoyladenylate synthase n=1 Tax=Rothia sp. CCM 9418 TaxID=3402661 RepID=UPI003AE366ED